MKTELWSHQVAAIAQATEVAAAGFRGFGIWHEMGAGKTRTAIEVIDSTLGAQRILVVCPKSVMPVGFALKVGVDAKVP